jgi:hypothetical protein
VKLPLLFAAVVGLTSLTSATPVRHELMSIPETEMTMTVPVWLGIADQGDIISIEHLGDVGFESSRGTVVLEIAGDGQNEMRGFRETFAARGYQLSDTATRLAGSDDPVAVLEASDPQLGRSAVFVLSQSAEGAILRITFDELAETAQFSGL